MRRVITPLLIAGACAVAAAPLSDAATTVRVADNAFKSKTVRVSRGATVKWRWVGKNPHNVTAKGFHSRTQKRGTFSHKFTRRGRFGYLCTIHAGMKGTVVVR